MTVDECFKYIQPFAGLTVEAISLGLCGETGEVWDELERPIVDHQRLSKELADIVVYAFLYMHIAEIPWPSKQPRDVSLDSFAGFRTPCRNIPYVLTLHFYPLNKKVLRLAEMEKKLLRGVSTRRYSESADLIFSILSETACIARRMGVNLDDALRIVILDNCVRHKRGDFGCLTQVGTQPEP